MGGFFNMDNGFFSALSKFCDILFLSTIWVLLCIPIVTIGPATTAMYYSTVKVIRKERGYLIREFFKSFRENFKNGAIFGVVITLMFIILVVDRMSAEDMMKTTDKMGFILFCIYNSLMLLLLCFTIYLFPVLSRFTMTKKQLLKSSFIMSLKHLPSTIVMVVIVVILIIATILIPALIFVTPCSAMLIISFLMERIFKKYMPKSEDEGSGKDAWYLE